MKIKKTYQGSVPLNRISNQGDNSEFNTYSTQYLNSKFCAISPTQPVNGEEVWIKTGKNIFNHNNLDVVGWLSQNGTEFSFDDMFYYSEIKIRKSFEVGVPYTYSFTIKEQSRATVATVVYWYKDGEYLERNVDTFTPGRYYITLAPEKEVSSVDIRFFRLNNNTTPRTGKVDEIQIERGDQMTDYEPYIEKSIYVRNVSGNYDEVYHEGPEDSYSTWEKRAGTWITGKPLYKRLFNCGTHPGDGVEINIPVDISNLENVHKMESAGTYGDVYFIPMPYISTDGTQKCQVFFKGGSDNIIGLNSNIKLKNIIVTLYYTKTTD
jgi:hypothetical protein